MPHVSVDDEGSPSTDLRHKDHGAGTPRVVVDGYPLSGRGFGQFNQPAPGCDDDAFAAYLAVLIRA